MQPFTTLVVAGVLIASGGLATHETANAPAPDGAGGAPPPADATGRAADDWIARTIADMTNEEKVGQLFVTHVYGAAADSADPRNRREYGVATPAEVIEKYHLGGITYFTWSDNVAEPLPEVAELSNGLQRAATGSGGGVPLLISTDQEQGTIARVREPATQFPGNMALGATRDAAAATQAAAITGRELAALGINQNFAPVADVNVDPSNPVIGVRSYGSDPDLVTQMTVGQVKGYERVGEIAATAKHFPGHGDTKVDSHTGIPVIEHSREEWDRIDAPPFEAAIDAGIDAIMTGHLVFPALDPSRDPATLSRPILTGILREELGFDGVVVTDSLGMQGVRDKYGDDRVPVLAINAGVDMLLRPPNFPLAYESVVEAVESGEISQQRLEESVARVLRLKLENGIVQDPYVDPSRVGRIVGKDSSLTRADRITERALTLVKNKADLLPLAQGRQRVLVTGFGVTATRTLADELTGRNREAAAFWTGSRPSDEAIRLAVEKATARDVVVVLTKQAWDTERVDPQARQQRLVKELLATETPVVVVSTQEPNDIAYFRQAPTYVAAYAYNPVTMKAVAKLLVGQVEPRGKLPMAVESADGSTTLYEYGHGLSW